MYKAKKTGVVLYGKYSDVVEYEYRGHKYDVEYPKGFTYCCTSPKIQHENAQAKIDNDIMQEKEQTTVKYEDTAQYGFDMFWEYVNAD